MVLFSGLKIRIQGLWRRITLVNWSGLILSVLKAAKSEDQPVDPKYIVIKPRILSDHNVLRGVAVLRGVLAFVPAANIAAPLLSLGETGFLIWKRIALGREWDELVFLPADPNIMRISVELDLELNKHFGNLILQHNWDSEAISALEKIYNDFWFITDPEMLRVKYPQVDFTYISSCCARNRDVLQNELSTIEQAIKQNSQGAVVDTNVKEAIDALKELFPAMRDWALFNSEGFNELVDIIDTAV
jgi:hypothetical protein